MKCRLFLFKLILSINIYFSHASAFEIIRDTELEQYTDDIMSMLLKSSDIEAQDFNIYFVNSNQINAFVTGGKNIFINTETIIEADDYREYAYVLAHELAHILGGHIFNTSIEISNLSEKAMPIYLLGIIGLITGATDTGLLGVMVGQASVNDGFTYYSRTQEASADQGAVKILCENGINAKFLVKFLNRIDDLGLISNSENQNYRSTHPSVQNRITWINSSLENHNVCNFEADEQLQQRFQLLKAKLHGFTNSHQETEAVYKTLSESRLVCNCCIKLF